MKTSTDRTTAAEVRTGWVIDIPDGQIQMLVTSVSEECGGLIRISGAHGRRTISYLLSPNAHVIIKYRE